MYVRCPPKAGQVYLVKILENIEVVQDKRMEIIRSIFKKIYISQTTLRIFTVSLAKNTRKIVQEKVFRKWKSFDRLKKNLHFLPN